MKLVFTLFFFSIYFMGAFCQCDCDTDDEAPVITGNAVYSTQTVDCGVDFYNYEPEFWDDCLEEMTVTLDVDTQYIDSYRWIDNAEFTGDDINIALTLILPGASPDYQEFSLIDGSVQYNQEQGTALYEGHLARLDDPDALLFFHIELENRMTASEWLDQDFPTAYRDDFGYVEDEYLYWDYYTISSLSYINGEGRYLGTYLPMTHAPPNFYYAWQEGVMANVVNFNHGSSCSFLSEGQVWYDGQQIPIFEQMSVSGSFYFDFSDCLIPEYTLSWTATDPCGNSITHTHILTINSQSDPEGCPCGVFGCVNEDADNYDPYATLSIGQCYGCSGDFNGDGAINLGDLVSFLAEFGCTEGCQFDINEDGVVNSSDLIGLLAVIGEGCE